MTEIARLMRKHVTGRIDMSSAKKPVEEFCVAKKNNKNKEAPIKKLAQERVQKALS